MFARKPVTQFRCIHCDCWQIVKARKVTVEMTCYLQAHYIAARCICCHRVTATKVTAQQAERVLNAGGRFRHLPSLSEKAIDRFAATMDTELQELLS